jgi:hypothetical protein
MELSNIISVSALLLSVLSAVFSVIQIRYTQAQMEIAIRNRITSARERIEDFLLDKISKYLREDDYDKYSAGYDGIYKSLVEDQLNAYEEACQKYIDNKVHRGTFIKSYKSEITNLFKNNDFKNELLNDDGPYDYKYLHMVREKWDLPI